MARGVLQPLPIPPSDFARAGAPAPILASHRDVFVLSREAKEVRRLPFAFGDEREPAQPDGVAIARKELHLGNVVLPTGEARRIEIMTGEPADAVVAGPDIGVFENLL